MEFTKSGDLIYTIVEGSKKELIPLKYRVEGNLIITDQPSHPGEQESQIELTGNKLTIHFGELASRYIKISRGPDSDLSSRDPAFSLL